MPAAQKIISQQLRQRKVKQFSAKHGLHFGVSALHCIADHDHIGICWNIFGAITFLERDVSLLQKDRHRRVNILIRTCDLEPAMVQRRRNGAHGRPANPQKMKTWRRFFHADSLRRRTPSRY